MLDRARRNFERVEIGHAGFFRPDIPGIAALEAFQVVEAYADALHADGLIQITRKRRETYVGKQWIVEIEFDRLA